MAGRVLGRLIEDVRGTYEFGRELRRGQLGVTYLVTHGEMGQQFACKSIVMRKLVNKDDVKDVRREVRIMHHFTGHRYIMIEEPKHVLQRYNMDDGKTMKEIIAEVDTDHDGRINYNEFAAMMRKGNPNLVTNRRRK